MPQIPPELGKKVSTRTIVWSTLVEQAWGAEYNAPDHGAYTFGGGRRKFDSSDRGARNGIYAVEPFDYVMANDNYPDMRTEIRGLEDYRTPDTITRQT